jgi:nucleotide-binding universal stress UspA family protein
MRMLSALARVRVAGRSVPAQAREIVFRAAKKVKGALMFKTIVWATDGSESADRALPFAKELAKGEGHKLVVVHGKEIFVGGRGSGYPVLANEDELEAKIRGQAAAATEEGLNVTLQIVSGGGGHGAHMIVDAAREHGADVIVVGTRGHSPVAGLLLGSVTQRLLHVSHIPVLAIPAGDPA